MCPKMNPKPADSEKYSPIHEQADDDDDGQYTSVQESESLSTSIKPSLVQIKVNPTQKSDEKPSLKQPSVDTDQGEEEEDESDYSMSVSASQGDVKAKAMWDILKKKYLQTGGPSAADDSDDDLDMSESVSFKK